MGTNYYVKSGTKYIHNGWVTDEILHIGKSSHGWYFSLHVIPWAGLNSFEDWKEFLKGKTIHDEYGRKVSYTRMIKTILRDCKDGCWGKNTSFTGNIGDVAEDHGCYKIRVGKYGLWYVEDGEREVVGDGCYTLVEGEFC